jgi:hypothetical protein
MPDDESSESEPEVSDDETEESEEAPADEEAEPELAPEGEWLAEANDNWDTLLNMRMTNTWEQEDVVQMHPTARNTGQAYARIRAQPLAPMNGFYDQRFVCATKPQDEIDEESDFEFLVGSAIDGIVPPRRVTLAMKGVQDHTVEMIARFLDETSLRYGDTVKAWREEGEGVRQLWLNDNPITDAGAAFLADALKNNQTIEELYLHYTFINDVGLKVARCARERRARATPRAPTHTRARRLTSAPPAPAPSCPAARSTCSRCSTRTPRSRSSSSARAVSLRRA